MSNLNLEKESLITNLQMSSFAQPWHTRTDKFHHGQYIRRNGWQPATFGQFGSGISRFRGETFLVPRTTKPSPATIGGRLRGKFERLGLV